jgi:hypothetical protein
MFAVERFRNPELDGEFTRSVIGRKRVHIQHLVRRAIDRGELPADSDVELIAEAPAAFLWHHALSGLPIDDDLLGRIVALVLP